MKYSLEKIVKVLKSADGGCGNCVKNLIEKWIENFSDYSKKEFVKEILRQKEKSIDGYYDPFYGEDNLEAILEDWD